MNEREPDVRAALAALLDRVDPSPGLSPSTVARARRRRAVAAATAVTAALVVGAVSWAVVAAGGSDDRPRPATVEAESGPHLYLSGKYGHVWRVGVDGSVTDQEIPELDPGDPPYHLLARGDALLGWGYETYLLDPELERPPTLLVEDSLFFIPSAHEDRVWIATEAPDTNRRIATVREVTVEGEVTVPAVEPPGQTWPAGAVKDGLLFHDGRGRIVWDPTTRDVVFRFDAEDLGPTHGHLVVWCGGFCHHIEATDVRTGEVARVRAPEGYESFAAWDARFSPDGETLAVPVRRGDASQETALALVDFDDGTAEVVSGTATTDFYNLIAWGSAGTHVFFTGADESFERQVFVYEVGSEAARLLDVDIGEFYDAAAL